MTSLSRSRKLSNTAFLIHWCVVHWPTAARVATRKPDVYPDSASVGVERVAVQPW